LEDDDDDDGDDDDDRAFTVFYLEYANFFQSLNQIL
jgi:hypothetical protein